MIIEIKIQIIEEIPLGRIRCAQELVTLPDDTISEVNKDKIRKLLSDRTNDALATILIKVDKTTEFNKV